MIIKLRKVLYLKLKLNFLLLNNLIFLLLFKFSLLFEIIILSSRLFLINV